MKDEIFDKIYEKKYYEHLIENKLMTISAETLKKELALTQILYENYQQK